MSVDLSTTYLGLELINPVVAAASPITGSLSSLKQLQRAGAAAVVLPSLFEEQIEHDELEVVRLLDLWALSAPESPDYFPELDSYNTGPGQYLELIRQAKSELQIPVIASLNGNSLGGWLRYAGLIEEAGADALELNIYDVPIQTDKCSAEVEQTYLEIVQVVKQNVGLPVAVKVGPYFSSIPSVAKRLAEAGADGLVLFNRYLAPDIDLEQLRFVPALQLSDPSELRLALRWIAILRDQLTISLAATGGVHQSSDIIKSLLVGANVVAVASKVIEQGPECITQWLPQLESWMDDKGYESVTQMCGSLSHGNCPNPEGLARANYMRALISYTPANQSQPRSEDP